MKLFIAILSLITFTSAIYTNKTFSLAKATTCNGADQVPLNVFFGYKRGTKTEEHRQKGLQAIRDFKSWLNLQPNRQSFSYRTDIISGYLWAGSMIQNSGFANSNALQVIYDEINKDGIPDTLYIEYVNGDPMKGFGVILTTAGQARFGEMQKAVKLWSEGKSYNNFEGSKQYKAKTVCYLSYSSRKPIINDGEAGNCDYFLVKSGENPSDTAGVNGESLQGYNPNLDFTKLQPGQPVCKSIGNSPNLKPSPNSDGTCKIYKVQKGDSCSSIAAKFYPLTPDDIDKYNYDRDSWLDCNYLQADYDLCVSSGKTPN